MMMQNDKEPNINSENWNNKMANGFVDICFIRERKTVININENRYWIYLKKIGPESQRTKTFEFEL